MTIDDLGNFFDLISLSYKDVEGQIAGFQLIFDQTRNQKVEWAIKLPMFVPSFYEFVKANNTVPSQNEYWAFYVEKNRDYLVNLNLSQEEKNGVRARVFRTYPSLVRDLHFGLYLKDNNLFSTVFYNEVLDIEYGIDLVVELMGERVGLNLFAKTKTATFARTVKRFRPKKAVDFPCFEIPVDFRGSKTCGRFFLYSDREVASIVNKINIQAEKK
jgi:hypothetical protein